MTREKAIRLLKALTNWDYQNEYKLALDKAIQALEQEPCEDCISRQAVLETIDNRIEQIKRDANEINKSYSHLSFADGIHDGYCRLKCDLRILSSVKPKEPCEDCISRQEAINSLGECPMNWTDSDGEVTAERDWKDTVEMLKRLPSVTPQPKMGHWIDKRCSICGCHSILGLCVENYCANCGAKMEVKE